MIRKMFFLLILLPVVLLSQELLLPDPVNYVSDFANVLTDNEEAVLNNILSEYESRTTIEIAIVTVESLQGYEIEEYSIRLAQKWKVGKAPDNNGLIILNSILDRDVRIEVGYGLEGYFTDAYTKMLITKQMLPKLQSENYFLAYKTVIEEITQFTGDSGDADKERLRRENEDAKNTSVLIILLVIKLLLVLLI